MTNRRTIVLFTRAPETEARAKGLPGLEGARLFAGFVTGWRQRATEAGTDLLVVTPEASCSRLARLLPGATVVPQSGETFGARLEAAFAVAFDRGASSALMVGGDGPPLDLSTLRDAFAHLELSSRAMFLVPARDGGVTAIGLNVRPDHCFAEIAWRTENVHRQLLSAAAHHKLSVRDSAEGFDLDSAADVAFLYRAARQVACWKPFRWLLSSILKLCRAPEPTIVPHPADRARLVPESRGPPSLSIA
jgi:glycosyltransferase A (GT-A) superfamily protein (DUF2064 family)